MNKKPAIQIPIEGEEEQFLRYSPFADRVVRRVVRDVPPHVDQADLLSAGHVGLVKALRGFDPGKGINFETFAKYRIRGAVFDELRSMDVLSRRTRDKARLVAEAENCLVRRFSREPTESEMASEMGLDLSAYRELRREIRPVNFVYLDGSPNWMHCSDSDDVPDQCHDSFADQGPSLGEELERRDLLAVLYRLIDDLPLVQKQVLALYYIEGLILRQIGEALGFTESYACLVHKAAIQAIQARLLEEDPLCMLVG